MKTGDRVRVIKIVDSDEDTALYVGATGTVIRTSGHPSDKCGIVEVKFDDMSSIPDDAENLHENGVYDMYAYQLKVIREEAL